MAGVAKWRADAKLASGGEERRRMTNFDVWWKHVPIEPKDLKKSFEFHARTAWALGMSEALDIEVKDRILEVRNKTSCPPLG